MHEEFVPKNIVVCCDGTNGKFGPTNTNVVKLFQLLVQERDQQVAFYDPGLGTIGAPGAWSELAQNWTKLLGLAFGYGLADRIGDAYRHVMEHYEEGDQVFLFGFSRGAYTVRALAAALHMYGLVRRGNENLIPYLTSMFRQFNKQTFDVAARFKATFAIPCPIHFVGVWDTVSSVGWIYNPVKLPYTRNNPSVEIGRHAMSIDERRCFFRQNLWGAPAAGQDLQQLWFAGVHSDVGGGYADAESQLANTALKWMVEEARYHGLMIDANKWAKAAPSLEQALQPRIHRSLAGAWWILEFWPKRHWDDSASPPRDRWIIPVGRRRWIAKDAVLHPSVLTLMRDTSAHYRPPNVPVQ